MSLCFDRNAAGLSVCHEQIGSASSQEESAQIIKKLLRLIESEPAAYEVREYIEEQVYRYTERLPLNTLSDFLLQYYPSSGDVTIHESDNTWPKRHIVSLFEQDEKEYNSFNEIVINDPSFQEYREYIDDQLSRMRNNQPIISISKYADILTIKAGRFMEPVLRELLAAEPTIRPEPNGRMAIDRYDRILVECDKLEDFRSYILEQVSRFSQGLELDRLSDYLLKYHVYLTMPSEVKVHLNLWCNLRSSLQYKKPLKTAKQRDHFRETYRSSPAMLEAWEFLSDLTWRLHQDLPILSATEYFNNRCDSALPTKAPRSKSVEELGLIHRERKLREQELRLEYDQQIAVEMVKGLEHFYKKLHERIKHYTKVDCPEAESGSC
nr:hypothetical protein L203_00678 [Cryptococcus depauperatus CBS 7841]